MNAVWDGLPETSSFSGHALFLEEDHLLRPHALRHLQALLAAKARRCPSCSLALLGPVLRGGGVRGAFLVTGARGDDGAAFNRSVWRKIRRAARVRGEGGRTGKGWDDGRWKKSQATDHAFFPVFPCFPAMPSAPSPSPSPSPSPASFIGDLLP